MAEVFFAMPPSMTSPIHPTFSFLKLGFIGAGVFQAVGVGIPDPIETSSVMRQSPSASRKRSATPADLLACASVLHGLFNTACLIYKRAEL
ncbi:hypothetical protein D5086_021474 [Populus alba]|uniref:Uncharacterized protein n=1 Tax=Populus alba TaxID=43335 RepID=A0ACC4BCU2_POPAL